MKTTLIVVAALALATSMASAAGYNKPGIGAKSSNSGSTGHSGKTFR
nr:hypothetical protein [Mesorhizobium loti]